MAIGLRNLEWLNHNASRRYPLTADAAGVDQSGAFSIPNDFLLSLHLSLNAGVSVNPAGFYVSTLGAFTTGYNIVIGYYNGSTTTTVASAMLAATTHTYGQSYRLLGQGDFYDATGHIVVGDLSNIVQQPAGIFTFNPTATIIEPDCVRPSIRGVSGVIVQNGQERSEVLTGTVVLSAGRNIRFTVVQAEGADPEIVVDAIDGEGLNDDCVCIGNALSPPIRNVNGIRPDANGRLTLLGSECLQVETMINGLKLTNPCSTPCCGCSELETLTQAMEQFGRQATTLENFLVSLEARVAQMDQVVLGSKLQDRGCITGS